MIARLRANIPRHLLVGLLLFAAISGTTIFLFHGSINSPDEAANLLFIRSWREHRQLSVAVPIVQPAAYPLFPRSTIPMSQSIVPAGFVGLPILFGTISIMVGEWAVFFLTTLFTMIAAVGWWYLMRQIFGRAVADISFWLFLFHPAVLYYSVRGLFPNMLMMDLVIISVAGAWYASLNRARIFWVLAAVAAVLAAAVRAPEAVGLLALVCIVALVWGNRKTRMVSAAAFGIIIILSALTLLLRNFGLIPGSYQFIELDSLYSLLFPFGIHLGRVWETTTAFIVQLFAPWVLLSSAGLAWWLWRAIKTKKFDRTVAAYLTVIVPASFWLFIMYGSWTFSDNLRDPNAVTLGASYVRYWLPHLLFRMPFAAVLVLACIEHWKVPAQKIVRAFIVVMIMLGLWRAFAGVDGLRWLLQETAQSRATTTDMLNHVPENAVVAVRAWDKFIYPHRAVLQPFPRDVRTLGAVHELLSRGTPVYAFVETFKAPDEWWLRDNGVVARVVGVYGVHTLYGLYLWNEGQ